MLEYYKIFLRLLVPDFLNLDTLTCLLVLDWFSSTRDTLFNLNSSTFIPVKKSQVFIEKRDVRARQPKCLYQNDWTIQGLSSFTRWSMTFMKAFLLQWSRWLNFFWTFTKIWIAKLCFLFTIYKWFYDRKSLNNNLSPSPTSRP